MSKSRRKRYRAKREASVEEETVLTAVAKPKKAKPTKKKRAAPRREAKKRTKTKLVGGETENTVETPGGSGEPSIVSQREVVKIGQIIDHPEFIFDPVIHATLANQLFLIFQDKLPGATTKDKHWTERARMNAAQILAKLALINMKGRPKQHEHDHRHAHVHIDALELANKIAALAKEKP